MKLKKTTWIFLAVALTSTLILACWSALGVSDVTLTQQQLQQKIDAKLPFTSKNGVTVNEAELDLSGNAIALNVGASASKLHTAFTIQAHTRGTLHYDNSRGAFYFRPDQLRVISAEANGVSVEQKASSLFDKYVKMEVARADKAELMGEAAELVQKSVQKSAEIALDRVPVYTLPDNFKGHVARMALSSVEVKDGTVIAHLSFIQFTGMVLTYLALGAATILIAVFLVVAAANGVALPFIFL